MGPSGILNDVANLFDVVVIVIRPFIKEVGGAEVAIDGEGSGAVELVGGDLTSNEAIAKQTPETTAGNTCKAALF